MREYEVEKIKRDIKILPIYEGTSEIQRSIISMFRMRNTVRSKGGFYEKMAEVLATLPEDCAGPLLADAFLGMNRVILGARRHKLTKSQYIMFLLADMMTWCEVGDSLCRKTAVYGGEQNRSSTFMKASARLFAREAIGKVHRNGLKIIHGYDQKIEDVEETLNALDMGLVMKDSIKDMDLVAAELVK